jgi:hypothetical protein
MREEIKEVSVSEQWYCSEITNGQITDLRMSGYGQWDNNCSKY